MAGTGKIAFVIAFWFLIVAFGECSKLNVPRVLLPIFKDFNTNFTLEVTDDGCYRWTTSRIDLIQLISPETENIFSDCSKSIVVSAITKERTRNTAIVFAEDKKTGHILRCDVIVDVICSLNLVTTTRELYMEEAPEAFEVRTYDDQGNEFTTLEGVEFKWSIGNSNSYQDITSGSNVLRFITFRDSPYETPKTVEAFDAVGKQGHIVLLEGMKTGSAKVSVCLPQPEYQHVTPIEIQLMVVANLIIDPADIYLLKGDSVQYRILQVHHGRLEEIELPSSQYYLEVENKTIAKIDDNALVTGLKKGKTKILLRDRNVDENEMGVRIPTATITVSSPCYLTLAILPYRNWIVIVHNHYEIIVEIFDSEDHKFYIGDGVKMSVSIPKKYFHVEKSTKNNTHHFGWPVEVGATQVNATLEGIEQEGKLRALTRISAVANMLIYNKITVYPCEVALPWDPYIQPKYEVSLNASGGDGSFVWSSGNTSVAMVTQNGLVKTHARGHAVITVAMTRNPHNREIANVFVLPASHLEIVEYVLEEEIGVPLYIHTAVFAEKPNLEDPSTPTNARIPFLHCNDLPLLVKVWSNSFENSSLKITPVGIACTTVAVVGTSLGSSKVSVSYTIEGYTMSADALVATYRPLIVSHPDCGQTVLAVGTSREVVFAGGPRPWIGRSSEHVHQITMEGNSHIIEIEELDNNSDLSDVYIYRILCRELGEVDVTLHVANTPSVKHCKKSESKATIKVLCARPRFISLRSELKVPEPANCPMNLNSEKVVTQNYKDVEVLVTVKDEHGYIFDNISSLYFDWKLSHPSLASIQIKGGILADDVREESVLINKRNYQILKPKGRTGVLEVSATIDGYQNPVLMDLGIVPEDPPFAITDEHGRKVTPEIKASLNVILVNDTIITPDRTSVFNHPKNKKYLQVNQGSGYYDFILSTDSVADVNYIESTRILEIIPKSDGKLRLALKDLCLESKEAVAEIEVLGIGSIKLEVPERVERGQCVIAVVRLFDTMNNLLPIPNTELLNLKAVLESGLIGVKLQPDDPKNPLPMGEIWFIVTGLELGDTSLKFIAEQDERRDVQSNSVIIQVFPPLKLMPRNITLIVGANFQISSHGGPQPDSNIEFSISSPDIANVSSSGVVQGQNHGTVFVTGKAVGINKVSGKRVVFSQDSVEVNVIPLNGIKIHVPLVRIAVGATMPVWAEGMPDTLTPIVIGALNPPLLFKWSVSAIDVGVINHTFQDFGLTLDEKDMVSMRFTAVSPGRTFVRLEVLVSSHITGTAEDKVFRDSLEIEVFEKMLLVYPSVQKPPVMLMAHYSQVQLKTNRDGEAQEMFYNVGGTMVYPDKVYSNTSVSNVLHTESEQIISVQPDGLVRSHGRNGRAIVMIVAKETSGIRQIMSVCVVVKPVQYIMLTVKKKVHIVDEEVLHITPRGFELEFVVTYHDIFGDVFTATKSNLRLRTNRFDYAQLRSGKSNHTVLANLMATGDTMLKVWDDQTPTQAADYVKLSAGEVIYPDDAKEMLHSPVLSVGDIVCFTLPLTDLDGSQGKWESSNENVLTIDQSLGLGKIRAPGRVIVKHYMKSGFTFTELESLAVSRITFLESSNKTLINVDRMVPFRVPIVLGNPESPDKINNLITRNGSCHFDYQATSFPFMCELRFDSPVGDVDVQDVFAVYQDFRIKDGTYGCVIISSGTPTLNKSLLNTNFSLHVFSGSVLSRPLKIPFLPAVFVHSLELNLSDAKMGAFLTVSGRTDILKQVEVHPYNTEFLTVGPAERIDSQRIYFLVRLTDRYWQEADLTTPMNVMVSSELTYQNILVSVQVRLVGQSSWSHGPCVMSRVSAPVSDTVYFYRHTFTIIGTLIVFFFVTSFVYVRYINVATPTATSTAFMDPRSSRDGARSTASVFQDPFMQPVPRGSMYVQPRIMESRHEPVYGDPQSFLSNVDVRNLNRSRRMH